MASAPEAAAFKTSNGGSATDPAQMKQWHQVAELVNCWSRSQQAAAAAAAAAAVSTPFGPHAMDPRLNFSFRAAAMAAAAFRSPTEGQTPFPMASSLQQPIQRHPQQQHPAHQQQLQLQQQLNVSLPRIPL
jgi:hypothetical protein